MNILFFLSVFCLGYIAFQDFKYRAVYWFLFPGLSLLLYYMKYPKAGNLLTLQDAIYALSFLAVQLIILFLYFTVKNRKAVNILKSHLGLGDVLFLVAISFYLSPVNYLLFYVFSLLLIIIYVLMLNLTRKKMEQIPLAGLQAIFFTLLLVAEIAIPKLKMYQDDWIVQFAYFKG
jgi:hypothetical protein